MNNDLITNVKKYSKALVNVVWSKIEKYIPFKEEIMQLYAEFRNAWETFLKTKQVVYVRDKVSSFDLMRILATAVVIGVLISCSAGSSLSLS